MSEEITEAPDTSPEGEISEGEVEGVPTEQAEKQEIEEIKDALKFAQDRNLRFPIKENGKVVMRSIDELIKADQTFNGGQAKFREANSLFDKIEASKKSFKDNPGAFLKEAGIEDQTLWLEERLQEKIDFMNLSDDEKRIKELEKKISDGKEVEEKQKKARMDNYINSFTEKRIPELTTEIPKALKEAGLPENKVMAAKVAKEMLDAKRSEKKIISIPDAVKRVKSHLRSGQDDHVKGLSPEKLVEMLGPGGMKKLRAWDLKQHSKKDVEQKDPTLTDAEVAAKLNKKPKKKYRNNKEKWEAMRNETLKD